MPDFSQLTFRSLAVHRVGNKMRNEGVLIAANTYSLSDELLRNALLDFFLTPFSRYTGYYKFTHPADIKLNELYTFCRHVFENHAEFMEQSVNIAKHLYNQSTHPKIQGGELCIAYFSDCVLEDELTDAIGIFKSEQKDSYLKPEESNQSVVFHLERGINLKNMDKGCLIFNTAETDGYRVLLVDKLSKSPSEAQYWRDDFLRMERVQDNGYVTENYLTLCHQYGEDTFGAEQGKKDQLFFLNKTLQYFTDHELFDINDFSEQVFEDKPEHAGRFKEFKERFEEENSFNAANDFKISQPTVKIMKRKLRSLIKLDTNIDIKLNSESTNEFIERGYDEERNMFFYKVYFNEEQ